MHNQIWHNRITINKYLEELSHENSYLWRFREILQKQSLKNIEFYSDEIVIDLIDGKTPEELVHELAEKIPCTVDEEKMTVNLDNGLGQLKIVFDDPSSIEYKDVYIPIFENIIYRDQVKVDLPDLACEVIACDSIGYKANTYNHALMVDADFSSPLLGEGPKFSFMDLIAMLQGYKDTDKIIDFVASTIDGNFIPAFRYEEQLLDRDATPYTLAKYSGMGYLLTEVLAKLAVKMGKSSVVIRISSGLDKDEAPLLLDPRVEKVFVCERPAELLLELMNKVKGRKLPL